MTVEVVTRMSLGQTSGHDFILLGKAMSWYSKKQNCITMSATEADCVSDYHKDKKHCHEVYIG